MGIFDGFFKGNSEKEKERNFEFESKRLINIIAESMDIINNTKNINTAISRFDTIKEMVNRLRDIKPASSNLSLKMDGYDLLLADGNNSIDIIKNKWMVNFYSFKINSELEKAELLSDKKLKLSQYKKALKIALDSISYLSDSSEIKPMINDIETKIVQIN